MPMSKNIARKLSGNLLDLDIDDDDVCCESPSPSDLVYARTHAELAGRKERPLSEGLCLRESLNTKDYWNWE